MEFRVFFTEDDQLGLLGVQVDILDPDHFWSEAARVSKRQRFNADGVVWDAADFNYGSGGHQDEVTPAQTARAKAEALLRAAEIIEELDRLWPPGSLICSYKVHARSAS